MHLREPLVSSRWNAQRSRDLVYLEHYVDPEQLSSATLAPQDLKCRPARKDETWEQMGR
jgi:hypothetical protein